MMYAFVERRKYYILGDGDGVSAGTTGMTVAGEGIPLSGRPTAKNINEHCLWDEATTTAIVGLWLGDHLELADVTPNGPPAAAVSGTAPDGPPAAAVSGPAPDGMPASWADLQALYTHHVIPDFVVESWDASDVTALSDLCRGNYYMRIIIQRSPDSSPSELVWTRC